MREYTHDDYRSMNYRDDESRDRAEELRRQMIDDACEAEEVFTLDELEEYAAEMREHRDSREGFSTSEEMAYNEYFDKGDNCWE